MAGKFFKCSKCGLKQSIHSQQMCPVCKKKKLAEKMTESMKKMVASTAFENLTRIKYEEGLRFSDAINIIHFNAQKIRRLNGEWVRGEEQNE